MLYLSFGFERNWKLQAHFSDIHISFEWGWVTLVRLNSFVTWRMETNQKWRLQLDFLEFMWTGAKSSSWGPPLIMLLLAPRSWGLMQLCIPGLGSGLCKLLTVKFSCNIGIGISTGNPCQQLFLAHCSKTYLLTFYWKPACKIKIGHLRICWGIEKQLCFNVKH